MKTGDRLERAEVAGRVDNHSEGPDRGRRRRRERSNSPGVKAKVVDVDERLRVIKVDGTRGVGGVAQVLGHDGDLARLSVPGGIGGGRRRGVSRGRGSRAGAAVVARWTVGALAAVGIVLAMFATVVSPAENDSCRERATRSSKRRSQLTVAAVRGGVAGAAAPFTVGSVDERARLHSGGSLIGTAVGGHGRRRPWP